MGKEKAKKRRKSVSEDSSASTSSDSEKEKKKLKKLKKKLKKEQKKTEKVLKKRLKEEKRRLKRKRKEKTTNRKSDSDSNSGSGSGSHSHSRSAENSDKPEEPSTDIPLELMEKSKAMAPMTKEEWEKRQNVVRRVLDEETGRHRLIKGDGEVLEEIVSRERHRQINRQATQADGAFYQAVVNKDGL